MVRRWLAAVLVTAATVSATLVMASPAQAWSYCTGSVTGGGLTLYRYQGYCEKLEYWSASFVGVGVCKSITSSTNNASGAAYNSSDYGVVLYNTTMCDSVNGTWKWMAAHTSDPDLYPDGMYHSISSFMFVF